MFNVGDAPKDVQGNSTNGYFSLENRRGRWVVLYFYPKDNTSGCTLEAQDFTSLMPEFKKLSCDIVGISRDSLKSHQNFCARHELSVELVSDKEEQLCGMFGVIKPKMMYGKLCRGIVRSTYLIDPEGKILNIWCPVKVPSHATKVLEELRRLSKAGTPA